MVAIIFTACMADNYINKTTSFRIIAYGMFAAVLFSMVLSLMFNNPLVGRNVEGTFGIYAYFNGGIQDKNVATVMLAIIISLTICHRIGNDRRNTDQTLIAISLLIILLSHSRGAWVHTFVFYAALNYRVLRKFRKKYRWFIFVIAVFAVVLLGISMYQNAFSRSETYMYRVRGWLNYIDMYKDDINTLIIGNGKIAYDQREEYTRAIRAVTGWNGSLEIAWLNILIKNGILGIVGFVLIFIKGFRTALKCKDMNVTSVYLAIIVTLLITSFVSTYMQNVHQFFGIYSYIAMSFFQGVINKGKFDEEKRNNKRQFIFEK